MSFVSADKNAASVRRRVRAFLLSVILWSLIMTGIFWGLTVPRQISTPETASIAARVFQLPSLPSHSQAPIRQTRIRPRMSAKISGSPAPRPPATVAKPESPPITPTVTAPPLDSGVLEPLLPIMPVAQPSGAAGPQGAGRDRRTGGGDTAGKGRGDGEDGIVLTAANWIRQPSEDEFFSAVPFHARLMHQSGRVMLSCFVRPSNGSLRRCRVLSETPKGYEFGRAALRLTSSLRVRVGSIGGIDLHQIPVRIPIDFNIR